MLSLFSLRRFHGAYFFCLLVFITSGLSAQSLSIVVPGNRSAYFNWQFQSSGGGSVQMGQFACGSYWVAPANGDTGVKLISLSGNPAWTDYLSCDADPVPEKMGLLDGSNGYGNYDASENLLFNLPATVTPPSGSCVSLVAAMQRNEAATGPGGTSAIEGEVADAYCVVTVMAQPPANGGSDMIRPNITGATKEFLIWDDFDLTRIPTYSFMPGNGSSGWESVRMRWSHSTEIFGGLESELPSGQWKYFSEGGRAFRAHILLDDYAAGMARVFNDDLLALFSADDSLEQKKAGLAAMLSFGLDIYHARYDYGSGYRQRWASGAGQFGGKFLPCVLLAALQYDQTKADVLRKVAITNHGTDGALVGPQELRQITRGRTGVHLWGDGTPIVRTSNNLVLQDRIYWAEFKDSACYDGAVNSCHSNEGSKAQADPYGYHDGPANKPGNSYMVISIGTIRGLAAAMVLMPEIRSVVNTDAPIEYADRVTRFGLWAAPDPVATISVTDQTNDCSPWNSGANCANWGTTWGPDPSDRRFAIENGTGRFTSVHGQPAVSSYETARAINNWASIIALYDGETYEDTAVGLGVAVCPDIFFETGASPKVYLESPNPDAEIRYTLDGSNPTSSSSLYTGPVAVSTGTEVRAKSYVSGMTASAIGSKVYDFTGGSSDTEAPSVPAGLAASNIADTTVDLDWNVSTDNVSVSSYRVYINGSSYISVSTNEVTLVGLTPNTSYTFSVAARDAAGNESAQSSGISVTTEPVDTQAPSVPTGLMASNLQSFSVDLDWNASSDNIAVSNYKVYTNGANPVTVFDTSITLSGLSPQTSYIFTVSAVDGAGNESSVSSPVSVTTMSAGSTLISENFATSAFNFSMISGGVWSLNSGRYILSSPNTNPPGVGMLANISVHDVNVAGGFWLSAIVNITGTSSAWNDAAVIFGFQDVNNYYYFSINESNDDYTKGIFKVENGVSTQLADNDASISSDTDYLVEIIRSGSSIIAFVDGQQVASATDDTFTSGKVGVGSFNDGAQFDDLTVSGSSGGNNDVQAPSVPTGLTSSNVTSDSVDLSWNGSSDNVAVTGYKVYINGINPMSVSGTSVTVGDLSASSSYSFTVSAVDAAGNESSQSSSLNVTTSTPPDTLAPSVPSGLASSNVSSSSVDLNWNASSDNVGVVGYKVYTGGSNPMSVSGTSITVGGLTASTSYTFTVSAVDAAGNESSQSSSVNVTTSTGSVQTVDIEADGSDQEIQDTGGSQWVGQSNMRVGGSGTNVDSCGVFPFELPTLQSGETITGASFSVNLEAVSGSPTGAVDLYGLDYRSSATVSASGDYFEGSYGSDSSATALDNNFATSTSSTGTLSTDATGESNLIAYINAQYSAGAQGGDYIFLRLNPTLTDEGNFKYWRISSANATTTSDRPVLSLEISGGGDTQAPSVPSGVSSSNVTTSSVDLSWSASSDNVGVTGYKVYINGSSPVSVSGTSTTISGLSAATSYAFTVSAYDAAGNESSASSAINVTTSNPTDIQSPSIPTGLTLSNVTTSSVDLSWNTSSDNLGVTGYKVYIDGINPVSVSGTSTTISSLSPSTSYTFTVSAYDAAGNESLQSSGVEVTTSNPPDTQAPGVPTGLVSSNVTANSVDLSWNASSDNIGVTGYKVYTNGSNPVSVSGTSITINSLSAGTSYSFTVSAVDAAANESAQSSSLSITTDASSGPLISEDFASGAGNFTVILDGSWSVSSGRYVLSSPGSSPTAGILGNISVHDTSVFGDFILTAVMRITGTSSSWNDAVVVFGYQNANNYYYLSLNESNDGNTKGLIKVVNGTPIEIADISISVVSDTDYSIQIERSGASLVALVNSSQVATASDSTFMSGKVGFGSFNDGATFDNLVVNGSGGSSDTTAPSVPTGLSASNITTTTVDLDWNTSTDNVGVAGYKIYTDGANPVSITGTSITLTGLNPGTSYSIAVSAYDATSNESSQSSDINITTSSSGGSSYYVDPATGSMSNPGTSVQPWSTLEAVFAAGKTFGSGDIIYLRNGYHGYPTITGNPSGRVTIQPQSGHAPTARQVFFNNASNFALNGLEISPELDSAYVPGSWIVSVNSNCSSIEISNCNIYSTTSISGWVESDWASKAAHGILCKAPDSVITGNTVSVVYYGIFLEGTAPRSEASYNTIENISVDGVRTLGNYQTVAYNVIRNFYGVNNDHRDGIQSYTIGSGGVGTATLYGTVIRGNVIASYTNASAPFKTTVQGIGCFDGFFEDWVIENNIICVDQWHGITFQGAIDCKIINNTVVENPIAAISNAPWIAVWAHKNGTASSGNIVRNNLTHDLNISAGMATVDNNIETSDYTSHFVDYANFDFHLKSTSSAVDTGSNLNAPSFDFEGDSRDSNPDIGADER